MICRRCKKEKGDRFYKGQKDCKDCCNEMVKAAKAKKPNLYSKIDKASKLRRLYSISIEQYNDMLIKQNYSCAICGAKNSGRKDVLSFAVDHCHTTNKVRGLLCMKCNTAIGKLQHDIEYLRKAIRDITHYTYSPIPPFASPPLPVYIHWQYLALRSPTHTTYVHTKLFSIATQDDK